MGQSFGESEEEDGGSSRDLSVGAKDGPISKVRGVVGVDRR